MNDTNATTTSAAVTPIFSYSLQHNLMIILNTWVLAPQIIFGCGGNILNLIVLLNKAMRSRTNIIFAAMAMSDLAFLLLHIPYVFFYLGPLMRSNTFRLNSYFVSALINWFSATSIWLMTYATLERVQVIRCPFRSSNRNVSWRFILTLVIIPSAALALTGVHFCNDLPLMVRKLLVCTHVVFVVLGPLVLCIVFNYRLVQALKLNNRNWTALDATQTHQQSMFQSRVKVEKKVTIVVIVIISCFLVCNGPGALLFVYREYEYWDPSVGKTITFSLLTTFCNTMTITGKVLNFVLFCLTSDHFRKLLKQRCLSCKSFHVPLRRNSWRSQKTLSVPLDIM